MIQKQIYIKKINKIYQIFKIYNKINKQIKCKMIYKKIVNNKIKIFILNSWNHSK